MLKQITVVCALLIFAAGILVTSVLRATSPQYVFSAGKQAATASVNKKEPIEYYLVYPGILPDHFLWPLKAARDKVWLFLTTDPLKQAELLLLLADKRVGAARVLLEGGKTELAVTTAGKAEKYLEEALIQEEKAREKKIETGQFLERLALSSLKHREVLEEMYTKAPEDARPVIVQIIDYPKKLFDRLKTILREVNRPIPPSPFNE